MIEPLASVLVVFGMFLVACGVVGYLVKGWG